MWGRNVDINGQPIKQNINLGGANSDNVGSDSNPEQFSDWNEKLKSSNKDSDIGMNAGLSKNLNKPSDELQLSKDISDTLSKRNQEDNKKVDVDNFDISGSQSFKK
ncbi:hypothetical protein ABK040_015191 [Willaertia magna]